MKYLDLRVLHKVYLLFVQTKAYLIWYTCVCLRKFLSDGACEQHLCLSNEAHSAHVCPTTQLVFVRC